MLGLILLLQSLVVAVSGPVSSPEYLPLRVAEAEGHFRREGLAVTLKTTRSEIGAAEALAQGQVDLAATSLEALLRFGLRPPAAAPRLVFALTAAPPVALLGTMNAESPVRSIENLRTVRVGVSAPGVPELAWLDGLLARANLRVTQMDLVSLGTRGLAGAVERGDVQAGLVEEPYASRLLAEGRATLVADLRSPEAVARALGRPTVNAAVFVRGERPPRDADLSAFARALGAAQERIATASPEALAAALPQSTVGAADEFARRVEATRGIFLRDGRITPVQLRDTIELIRAHMPLSGNLRIPRPEQMLHLAPLTPLARPRRD
ncbi:MAG: ABC transporter substrate-binding protein [Candidatus Rokubacteria bacterium]|nr:ABC transporter substrate-binding protein [Candidatus Rokubacteria bacterium]